MSERRTKAATQALDEPPKGPTVSAIGGLLTKLRENPRSTRFAIPIAGQYFYFRYPSSSGEMSAFSKQMFEFVIRMRQDIAKGALPPAIKSAIECAPGPVDDEDLANAFCLSYWADVETPINQAEAIECIRLAPPVVVDVINEIDKQHMRGLSSVALGTFIEAKKNSQKTMENNSDTKPVGDISTNTRTI